MTQTQTQIHQNSKNLTLKLRLTPIAIPAEAKLPIPALQAFDDSPNWNPIPTKDDVLYQWGAEAIYWPSRGLLFYITRRSKKVIVIFVGEGETPGGRISNVMKAPTELYYSQFPSIIAVTAILFSNLLEAEPCIITLYKSNETVVEFRKYDNENNISCLVRVNPQLEYDTYPVFDIEVTIEDMSPEAVYNKIIGRKEEPEIFKRMKTEAKILELLGINSSQIEIIKEREENG